MFRHNTLTNVNPLEKSCLNFNLQVEGVDAFYGHEHGAREVRRQLSRSIDVNHSKATARATETETTAAATAATAATAAINDQRRLD
jgi:hypothetical protein